MPKVKTRENQAKAVAAAKMYLELITGERPCARSWLSTSVDSYDSAHNRVELQVLEGSPPRGYLLIRRDRVLALDGAFERPQIWNITWPRRPKD